jgi:hypothetical protein
MRSRREPGGERNAKRCEILDAAGSPPGGDRHDLPSFPRHARQMLVGARARRPRQHDAGRLDRQFVAVALHTDVTA